MSGLKIIARIATLALAPALLCQQPLIDFSQRPAPSPAAVEFLSPDRITVPAGKRTTVALHFRIAPGLHINSHAPRDPDLIPANLSIPDGTGLRLLEVLYPPGTEYALPIDPKTKLSVYSGEFTLQARILAAAGTHSIQAALRYQACDQNACMPPKTIAVTLEVTGK
jgi:DsbC/DsbD-like thiol-disulfide interchange protein